MLFNLRDSIFDNIDEPEVFDLLVNVHLSYKNGSHLFYITRSQNDKIQDSNLNSQIKETFKRIMNESMKLKTFLQNSTLKVYIHFKERSHPLENIINEIWICSHYAVSNNILIPTIILSENQGDIEVYNYIAQYYNKYISKENFGINFSRRGGGGSTTKDELYNINIHDRKLCLCLSDTDKKYPTCNYGSTLKDLQAMQSVYGIPLTKIFIYEAHEIENLLPTHIIIKALQDINPKDNRINSTKSIDDFLKKCNDQRIYMYLDIKLGILGKHLFDQTSEFFKYWSTHLIRANTNGFPFHCTCSSADPTSHTQNCTCAVIQGLGKRVAQPVSNYLRDTISSIQKDPFLPYSPVYDYWVTIGKEVIEWCCAPLNRQSTL